jgi:hypothetical protein
MVKQPKVLCKKRTKKRLQEIPDYRLCRKTSIVLSLKALPQVKPGIREPFQFKDKPGLPTGDVPPTPFNLPSTILLVLSE